MSSTRPIQSRAAALGRRSLSPLHDPQRLTHCTTAVFDHIRAGSLESTATRPQHAGLTPSRPELVGYSAPAVSRGSPRGDRRLPCGRQHQPPTTLADCSPSSSAQPRQREEDAGAASAGGTSARRCGKSPRCVSTAGPASSTSRTPTTTTSNPPQRKLRPVSRCPRLLASGAAN